MAASKRESQVQRGPIPLRPLFRAYRDRDGNTWIRRSGVADECCACHQWIYRAMECYEQQTRLGLVAHVYCVTMDLPHEDKPPAA